jgi:hypothetical protein
MGQTSVAGIVPMVQVTPDNTVLCADSTSGMPRGFYDPAHGGNTNRAVCDEPLATTLRRDRRVCSRVRVIAAHRTRLTGDQPGG